MTQQLKPVLLLQRTLIQFLAPMMGSSKLPTVTPAPGDPTPSVLCGHWHLRVYIGTYKQLRTIIKMNPGCVGMCSQSEW